MDKKRKTINIYLQDWEAISKWAIDEEISNAEVVAWLVKREKIRLEIARVATQAREGEA